MLCISSTLVYLIHFLSVRLASTTNVLRVYVAYHPDFPFLELFSFHFCSYRLSTYLLVTYLYTYLISISQIFKKVCCMHAIIKVITQIIHTVVEIFYL